jgi:hypothetical protein
MDRVIQCVRVPHYVCRCAGVCEGKREMHRVIQCVRVCVCDIEKEIVACMSESLMAYRPSPMILCT